ncbi:hypothetical protein BEP19_09470 [Ammoniphilus oxalaticus]|uniref:Uncharacterized protein n=1 Tax=Ammoniphilus oxalaticus TaxID=66863 RepID=A0A419SKZ1_9BACL|nr:hypothetical protein [Ammoniphilus oxalaticus]RKD24596.1 hypothetical protein BEP19_09470 [Ammoniphilus oxalaticus]
MGVRKDCFCDCVANMKRNLREHFSMGQPGNFVLLLGNNGGFLGVGTITDIEHSKVVLQFPPTNGPRNAVNGGFPDITFEVSICAIGSIVSFDYGQMPEPLVLEQLRNRMMGL